MITRLLLNDLILLQSKSDPLPFNIGDTVRVRKFLVKIIEKNWIMSIRNEYVEYESCNITCEEVK